MNRLFDSQFRAEANVRCSPTSGCSCCYEITCILEPMAHCSKIFCTHTVYWSVLASCCLILFLYFSKPVSWNRPELFVYSPWTLQSGLALHPVCIHVFFHHCTDLGPISTVFTDCMSRPFSVSTASSNFNSWMSSAQFSLFLLHICKSRTHSCTYLTLSAVQLSRHCIVPLQQFLWQHSYNQQFVLSVISNNNSYWSYWYKNRSQFLVHIFML